MKNESCCLCGESLNERITKDYSQTRGVPASVAIRMRESINDSAVQYPISMCRNPSCEMNGRQFHSGMFYAFTERAELLKSLGKPVNFAWVVGDCSQDWNYGNRPAPLPDETLPESAFSDYEMGIVSASFNLKPMIVGMTYTLKCGATIKLTFRKQYLGSPSGNYSFDGEVVSIDGCTELPTVYGYVGENREWKETPLYVGYRAEWYENGYREHTRSVGPFNINLTPIHATKKVVAVVCGASAFTLIVTYLKNRFGF